MIHNRHLTQRLQGSPFLPYFPRKRIAHEYPFSDSVVELMKSWLVTCTLNHKSCPAIIENQMPTRLIWVGSDNTTPRLVVTKGLEGRWAALSHCWGFQTSNHESRTTIRTLDRHCQRLLTGSLPQSFRDAIAITRKLGLDYLWIDSLCIVQDSEVDWISESAKMGDIYEYAAVTLIAEAAENSRQGIASSCRRGRKRLMSGVRAICHSDTLALQGEIFFKLRKRTWHDTSVYGPLSFRGWTLQEEILSPKILRFTEHGVFGAVSNQKLMKKIHLKFNCLGRIENSDTSKRGDVVTCRR